MMATISIVVLFGLGGLAVGFWEKTDFLPEERVGVWRLKKALAWIGLGITVIVMIPFALYVLYELANLQIAIPVRIVQ